MNRKRVSTVCVLVLTWLCLPSYRAQAQTLQTETETAKGESHEPAVAHPLSWWTQNRVRLNASGDLMIGFAPKIGYAPKNPAALRLSDYRVTPRLIPIGTIAGYRIVQLMDTIEPGPRAIASGYAEKFPIVWKTLLAGRHGRYVALYTLDSAFGAFMTPFKRARIYGSGANAILGSFDPDTGNGGGCSDGYWWFDQTGPHPVDFSPLAKAIKAAAPQGTEVGWPCRTLHPEQSEVRTAVQIPDECHSCGILGTVDAHYRIEHGAAVPVSVKYLPGQRSWGR